MSFRLYSYFNEHKYIAYNQNPPAVILRSLRRRILEKHARSRSFTSFRMTMREVGFTFIV
jgi:hypothetical protein